MTWLPPEGQLAVLLLAFAGVLATGWRFARRFTTDPLDAAVDTGVLAFAVMYVSVGVPGLLGVLHPLAILAVTAACCVGLALFPRRPAQPLVWDHRPRETWTLFVALAFMTGFCFAAIWRQSAFPPTATDPLTYHLPAAVQWLQDGAIRPFQTWYFNPANTYSPLAGSVLLTWWLAPLGHDMLARYVQFLALALIFLALLKLVRDLSGSLALAAIVGFAAACARAIISQVVLEKDDLYVAAFVLTAVAALTERSARSPLTPWRLGVCVGLMLATKYTALYSLLLLLLAVDAPWRAGRPWRDHAIIAVVAIALAGPWFVRNLLLTGNALFPVRVLGLPGLLRTTVDPDLRSLAGITRALVTHYFGLQWPLALALPVAWVVACAALVRTVLRDPVRRLVLLAPPLGLAVFLATAPYAEIRFVYPSLLLAFAAPALLAGAKAPRVRRLARPLAGVLLVLSLSTSFTSVVLLEILPTTLVATAFGLVTAAAFWFARGSSKAIAAVAAAIALLLAGVIYVEWPSSVQTYSQVTASAWEEANGDLGQAWAVVRQQPPDEALAYAHTHLVYPLQARNRRVFHVPVRADVTTIADLPPFDRRLASQAINVAMVETMLMQSDREAWLERLRQSGAKLLFVAKVDPTGTRRFTLAPERTWVQQDPSRFDVIFENDAAVLYRITQD